MAKRRRMATYRRRNQNRFSMFLVSLVVVMIMVVVAVKSVDLKQKIDAKAQEEEQLVRQIEVEKVREQEIEDFGKEVQTKGYIENLAREKLGLVKKGEIMFKEGK
ncbi:MAG: septum formation initiator family protein [Acetatifactor sp.]|nr:septum formation initiator family protein [Acetatifactor sp.]